MALPALSILVPLVAGVLSVFLRGAPVWSRAINVVASAALLGIGLAMTAQVRAEGIQVVVVGGWPVPFGIVLAADVFGAAMVAVTGFVALCSALYALGDVVGALERKGFHALFQFLLMGVCGAFLTGDLFNLFVWFEVMLMASFVLLAMEGGRPQLEASIKYVTLNFLSSGLFLSALGLLYAKAGSLNMAELAVRLRVPGNEVLGLSTAMLLLVAFGIKAGVFPLFSWLPASYHTPPVTVSALFAGLLTKVGVFALMRVFTLIFDVSSPVLGPLLVGISILTMVVGVLGATAQYDIRRILSFHIVSQIGYMTLGLALGTEAALAAGIFYIIHHIVVKTNLFFIGGAVERACGTGALAATGGVYKAMPWLAVLFLVPAMSLGGIPPLSGFFAKFALVKSGIEAERWLSVAAALAVGLLTLFSMTKIWAEAFWKAPPEGVSGPRPFPKVFWVPIVAMAAVTVWIGLNPGALLDLAKEAAAQLTTRTAYLEAVLPR